MSFTTITTRNVAILCPPLTRPTELLRDHFQHVSVRVPEKEAFDIPRPQRSYDLGPRLAEAVLQRREAVPRIGQGDVPAVFALEGRGLEIRHLDQVDLLAGGDLQPGGCERNVIRTIDRPPAQGFG